MCLDTIDKKTKTAKSGWKVFRKIEKYLDCEYVAPDMFFNGSRVEDDQNTFLLPTEQWLDNKYKSHIFSTDFELYESGFHVFKSKKQARNWADITSNAVICKVLMENIVVSGTQITLYGATPAIVFVTQKIFIKKPDGGS